MHTESRLAEKVARQVTRRTHDLAVRAPGDAGISQTGARRIKGRRRGRRQAEARRRERLKDQVALAAKVEVDLRDPDNILRALAPIAFANMTDLFDEHGNLRALQALPDDIVAAIASIKVVQHRPLAGQKGVVVVQKVELSNKVKALELLAKLFGLRQERSHVSDDAAFFASRGSMPDGNVRLPKPDQGQGGPFDHDR